MASRKNVLTHGRKQKAIALYKAGRLQEARGLLLSVCERDRTDAEAWLLRGAVCGRLGEHTEAAQCFRHLTDLQPHNAEGFYNLGIAERSLGATEAAEQAFRRATEINPAYPEALECLAHLLLDRGALSAGSDALRTALALRPDNAEWHVNLGAALQMQGLLGEAIGAYERARALRPGSGIASENLGSTLASQGRLDEAIALYREGLRRNPGDARTHSNLLLTLNYLCQGPARVFAEHRRWEEMHGASTASQPFTNSADPERPLRIGYVSPDFRAHSVAFFIEPILAARDRKVMSVYCYADVARPDAVTERLRQLSDHWRPTHSVSDTDLMRQIREDKIDILVDLAGHTAGHRLAVFAQRAAPLQVTYLGYPNTTGLGAMDYRITDTIADPADQATYCSERLLYLDDCFLCYRPPADAPAVSAPPAQQAGHITFGSFNNLAKIQPGVVARWAELLHAVPRARLLLKNPSLTDAIARDRVLDAFTTAGITPDRIDLLGLAPSQSEHLALYGRVDIALDTFPYNGTTTTCEALWMGVPVVTFAGRTHAGRVGASLLTAAGLTEFIAASPQDYVARAAALAADVPALVRYRTTLRDRVGQSLLCNAAHLTRNLETALRGVWRERCA